MEIRQLVNLNRCTYFNVLVTAVVSEVLHVINLNASAIQRNGN